MNTIVIDTNILISALIKEGITRKIITNFKINFLFPEFEFIEIKMHKQEILEKSGLSDDSFRSLFSDLLKYVKIIRTERIINYRKQATEIIGDVDKDDVIFIATALAFNCPIWTEDNHFKKQDRIKIFTTKDMLKLLD